MTEEQDSAVVRIPEDVFATLGGIAVTILELSATSARVAHDERLPLPSPELRIAWRGSTEAVRVRVARSQIAGRQGSRLVYNSDITFVESGPDADRLIAAIVGGGPVSADELEIEAPPERSPEPPPQAPPQPVAAAEVVEEEPSDDSWTRRVKFLQEDLEEELPYAQYRLTARGWEKDYVASPAQPEDGFTLARNDPELIDIQHAFEVADPETRRMLQIALESKLTTRKT